MPTYIGYGTSTFKGSPTTDAAGHGAFVFDTNATVSNADLFSLRNNGTDKVRVDANGTLNLSGLPSPYTGSWINFLYDTGGTHTSYKSEDGWGGFQIYSYANAAANSLTITGLPKGGASKTNQTWLKIDASYSQAGVTTGLNNTDFLIERTETALTATGTQSFADFRVGGATRFRIDNLGNIFTSGTKLAPYWNNVLDIGTSVSSVRNIYASGTVAVAGGSAAAPAIKIGDPGTGYGIFAPVAGYSIGITTAGVQRFKCDAGDCTVSQNLYVSGKSLPNINNAHDIGDSSLSWKDIYASGTAYIGTDVKVGLGASAQSVCLANGTNCPLGYGSSDDWTYSLSGDFVRPNTSTTAVSSTRHIAHPGSASAPGFTFSGDENTGIYQSGANQLDFSVNGSWKMMLNGSNLWMSVIPTPTPSNTYDLGTSAYSWKDIYASGTAYIKTAVSTTLMVAGQLGVGTASPWAKAVVAVGSGQDAFAIHNLSVNRGWEFYPVTNGSNTDIRMYEQNASGNGDRIVFQAGGNVGIGDMGPTAKLTVSKTYSNVTGGEQFGTKLTTVYTTADSSYKQGLRLTTYANHATGTMVDVIGLLSLITSGVGSNGTTTNATNLWARNDVGASKHITNSFGLQVNDGAGAGTVGTQYGVYIAPLYKGAVNYALYT
ncbi:hypothetical protein KKF45_04575, partial [Patescibacteria group bacterium]|nr:hypothetical protein [Patescibacteria group bacterium]